ncbi:lysyl oxidase family protein [Myxococcus sp. Y35]|uniref:lysyl oxidase family protein n=1 Tax=Pseudomyxococcus flavus TaxID=3115648 RepID=UPI003CF969E8
MQWFRALTLTSLLAVSLCACDDPEDPSDAGTPDAGAPDAGQPDAGTPDAGVPDAGPPDAGAPDAGSDDGGTFLSEVPLWEVQHDPAYATGCFGRSIALGDVNGDGRKDLIVAAPPCLSTTRDPGQVSLFAGEAPYFSTQRVTTVMDWRNTNARTNGNRMMVSTGDVDGDGHADVLVSGQYGALVFKGQADLGAVFSEPAFVVPGGGVYNNAVFADVNGDGLDDVVSVRGAMVSVFLATPGAPGGPFTLAERTQPLYASGVRRAGDVDGDGAQDLLVTSSTGGVHALFHGCKADAPGPCDGALAAQPFWGVTSELLSLFPDLNEDGVPERFLGPGGGTVRLHLSEAGGGYSSVPTWAAMGDPVFAGFGSSIVAVGDMDGDGHRQDFVVGSDGRLYLYSPVQGVSADLNPVWAWPRGDALPPQYTGFHRFAVIAPGDLNGDGLDDLVAGMAPPSGLVDGPAGRVAIFGGGQVPAEPASAPHLPPVAGCGLSLDPEHGMPDLAVDADVLARSLYVERRTFAADSCEILEGCVPAPGERRLLRFSTSIQNLGSASASVPNWEERPDLYVWDECHGHDHLTNFAQYALRDAQGNEVVEGRKQGFYLVDYHRQCDDAAPFHLAVERMSISAGWTDIYVADIPCQWIDITDLADGTYSLRVGVDEQDIIEEADLLPNEAILNVRIEGDAVTVVP